MTRIDHDPEMHSFEVRPETDRDLNNGRGHILMVRPPSSIMSTSHNLTLAELADLHDRIGAYLDEQRG